METFDRRRFLSTLGLAAVALRGRRPFGHPSLNRASDLDPRLARLAARFRGPIISRGRSGYELARLSFNRRFDAVHPLAVVRPADVGDVQTVVSWARTEAVPLAIRSGGHSYGGYSSIQGGVVVDLSSLAGICVDAIGRTATVGGGARLVDVYAALARHGLLLPAGSCPSVGIAGLTLGGGVGFAARRFGSTADNLTAVTLITADGSRLVCSQRENPDLFWACRGGGGGNFGVVTALRFAVHPAPQVSFFVISWPWPQAVEALDAWQRFAPHAPDELFSICSLETGGPRVQAFGQFFGPSAQLRSLLAPLARVRGATLQIGTRPYLDTQLRWAGCLGKTLAQCHLAGLTPEGTLNRAAFAAKSDYARRVLSPRGLETIAHWVEAAEQARFGSAALICDSYGGVLNRVHPSATAFVHRDSLFSAQYLSYWRTPGSMPLALEWTRGFHAAMRPHVSGFAYQNYIDPELHTWKHAYYGTNYPRLVKIKARVDPDQFFRFAQAIPAA
jgi:FAD/FMN-containing dehydrogenase